MLFGRAKNGVRAKCPYYQDGPDFCVIHKKQLDTTAIFRRLLTEECKQMTTHNARSPSDGNE